MNTITKPADFTIRSGEVTLRALVAMPADSRGIVVFSHGSGSGRKSPRNQFVAEILNDHNLATVLVDLLTPAEDENYESRFDIQLLTRRLEDSVHYAHEVIGGSRLRVGVFGASTGAASALNVAAELPSLVKAVVSRGGRPDLARMKALQTANVPTLLIVGGRDTDVLALNRAAYAHLRCVKELAVVPGATHLFEEPGTLEEVAQLSVAWFNKYLVAGDATQG